MMFALGFVTGVLSGFAAYKFFLGASLIDRVLRK